MYAYIDVCMYVLAFIQIYDRKRKTTIHEVFVILRFLLHYSQLCASKVNLLFSLKTEIVVVLFWKWKINSCRGGGILIALVGGDYFFIFYEQKVAQKGLSWHRRPVEGLLCKGDLLKIFLALKHPFFLALYSWETHKMLSMYINIHLLWIHVGRHFAKYMWIRYCKISI